MSSNFENPQTGHKYFMKWDTMQRVSNYKVSKISLSSASMKADREDFHFPFSWKERERLSQTMSTTEILQTSEYVADQQKRRERKWKEARYFWNKTVFEKVYSGNLENCFWSLGSARISVTQFVTTVVKEYKIINDLSMESHLKWLYFSLEGGKEGKADWRELFCIVTVMTLFRLIKKRPEELMMKLFGIYSSGGESSGSSIDDMYLKDKSDILRILKIPVISDFEESSILEYYDGACSMLLPASRIYRSDFKMMLSDNRPMVQFWNDMLWKRLPSDVRLIALDEIEDELIQFREMKMMKYLHEKAIRHFFMLTTKRIVRAWRQVVIVSATINRQRRRVLAKKMRRMFIFWRRFAGTSHNLRRRQLLADVMGSYTVKARVFARIKLFNFLSLNILSATGDATPQQMQAKEGSAKLRYARTKHFMRRALHRWADLVGWQRNNEIAEENYFFVLMKKCVHAWSERALRIAKVKKAEIIALENQNFIRDVMIETEENAQLLVKLEMERMQQKKEEDDKKKEEEKAHRLLVAKQRAQAHKMSESKWLLELQKDIRRKRVAKQMSKMRKKFAKLWNQKEEEMIDNAASRAIDYYNSEDNQLEMELRMLKLKKAFFAPPSVDNAEREKIISNPKNIVFLYLEAKMAETKMDLKDVIPKFDLNNKGYLSYDEFRSVIDSLRVGISANQVTQVIEGVDIDKDGFIELNELEEAMTPVEIMGVKLSPWKFYVDPATDVICYHNFDTKEKIFEYKMTTEIMQEVNKQNLIAEYKLEAKTYAKKLRREDWQKRLENLMAKRIQNMAHLWFGRKRRKKLAWKLEQRNAEIRTMSKREAVAFVGKKFRGYKARRKFERQLWCIWEKVWDLDSQKIFYYNHVTKAAVWDRPLLLIRYEDVENPPPWIAGSVVNGTQEYWHVLAKRSLQRKPDGFMLCQTCNVNIATRKCVDCEEAGPLAAGHPCYIHFCGGCYRATHGSPFGFLQTKRPNKLQRIDTDFMSQLAYSSHEYELVSPLKCEQCKSTKVNAGLYCQQCDKKLCRACYRRIHSVDSHANHSAYAI